MSSSKFFFSLVILFAFVGCAKKTTSPVTQKPLILVSIAPYKGIAERIAGPDFTVETVVPAATNPHAFEPTSSQVSAIGKGLVWFRIGEPFEKKILPILQGRNEQLTVADLREGIAVIEEHLSCKDCSMDHQDRHIWLSPKLAMQQANLIEKTLSEKFPERKNDFQKNLMEIHEDLLKLDEEIRGILKGVENRTLLVSHPAFAYFCKDFDLVQLSIEYEGKDPRPKHLEEILTRAVTESATVALALPQYNNKGAQLIAEKLHKPIRYIDPYSADYFETLRKLAHLIADPYAN